MSVQIEEATATPTLEEVQNENRWLAANNELLQENMADVIMALDNVGQRLIGEDFTSDEVPLDTVRNKAKTTRALVALNPLAKRGVAVRSAYIWGGGVEYIGLSETDPFFLHPGNQKFFLSAQAHGEAEVSLATDGNRFLLVTKARGGKPGRIARVPAKQITGTISDPDNVEDVWFYKREWDTTVTKSDDQAPVVTNNIAYYAALDYDAEANGRPLRIGGKNVFYNSVIAHQAVNKQAGWRWGLGDLTSVIFWAGAHKEFLESSARMMKALSRYAFKVTTDKPANVQQAATKVGTPPTRDAFGHPNEVGATAAMSTGSNLQMIGRTGGAVDFKAGVPLAGYVAAGLEIPLTELLSDAGEANRSSAETLDNATHKAMTTRQRAHAAFEEAIFKFLGLDVKLKFPPISEEAVYRQIQAIAQAIPFNVLTAKEVRAMFARAFDLELDSETLPTEEELGLMLASNTTAGKEQAELAKKAAEQPANSLDQNPSRNPKVKKDATNNPSNGDNGYRKDAQKSGSKS